MSFKVLRTSGGARLGRLLTAHGPVNTPVFMPVATGGAIRGLTSAGVAATGTRILLSNAWHLMLQPGDERIAALGGLHRLMAWDSPILTDSGGYQVASLKTLRKISESGVHLRSYRDGSNHDLTPERAIACWIAAPYFTAARRQTSSEKSIETLPKVRVVPQ